MAIKKFLPILVILAIILLTLQTPAQTQAVSSALQTLTLRFIDAPWIRNMKVFRTVLHAPLYFLLGVAVAVSCRRFWSAVEVCSMVAVLDETFKIFLSTREFSGVDLVFDAAGFLIGIGIVWVVRKVKSGRESG